MRLLIEDWDRVCRGSDGEDDEIWPAWSKCSDAREYVREMGLMDVSIRNSRAKDTRGLLALMVTLHGVFM